MTRSCTRTRRCRRSRSPSSCGGCATPCRSGRASSRRRSVAAGERLARARIDGVDWYWPDGESLRAADPDDAVRLLAPFDPIVWDRARFETFWGWAYRFEAYTPAPKRKLGYYALPLLWRDRVIGWANVIVNGGGLDARVDYVEPARTREPAFTRELDLELDRMRLFLGLGAPATPPGRSSQRTARLPENAVAKGAEPSYD